MVVYRKPVASHVAYHSCDSPPATSPRTQVRFAPHGGWQQARRAKAGRRQGKKSPAVIIPALKSRSRVSTIKFRMVVVVIYLYFYQSNEYIKCGIEWFYRETKRCY